MKEGDVYVRGFEEGGGCELFDDLQQYGSEEVDEKVKEMILKYWGTADQDQEQIESALTTATTAESPFNQVIGQ